MADDTELAFVARLRDEASRAARGLRRTLDSVSGPTRPITTGVTVRDNASRSLRGIQTTLGGLDRASSATWRTLATGARFAATGVGAAMGVAGGFAIRAGIQTAAGMETAKIGFTTMLGSAKRAKTFLADLTAFAAKTPFDLPGLQTASSSLISAGIDANKVIPIMTTLGNVTSGMGTGAEGVQRATVALQQMSAAGKITGEDLNQLRDAGIPVFDLLAAATGKSKKEVAALAQAGKLGGKELAQLMKALETGKGLERFSGLMEKQSASLTGQWSTLKDNANIALAGMIEPVIPDLKRGMAKVSGIIADAGPAVKHELGSLVNLFHTVAAQGIKGAGVDDALGEALHLPPAATKQILGIVRDLADVFSTGLLPAIKSVSGTMPLFLSPLKLARSLLGFMADHTTLTRVALTGLVGALLLGKAAMLAYTAVTKTAAAISTAYALATGRTTAVETLHQRALIQNRLLTLKSTASMVAAKAVSIATAAASKAMAAGQWLVNAALAANPIGIVVVAIAALVAGFILAWKKSETFRAIVTGAFDGIKVAAKAVAGFFTGPFLRAVGDLVSTWLRGAGLMVDIWFTVVGKIIDGAVAMMGWVPGVGGKLKKARDAFHALGDGISSTLQSVADKADGWGEQTAEGFIRSLNTPEKRARVKRAAAALGRAAEEGVAGALEIFSPSRVMARLGDYTAEGFARGITGGLDRVDAALDKMRDKIHEALDSMKKKDPRRAGLEAVLAMLKSEDDRLEATAKRRDRLADKLAKANDKLRNAVARRADYAKAVRSAAISFASATNITTENDAPLTAGFVVQGLRERLAALRAFARNIAQLRARHLNKTTLRQIIDAGVEGGGATAAALASGTNAQIAEVDRAQAAIGAAAKGLGDKSASTFYDAGVKAAKGLVDGLKARRAELDEAAKRLARRLAKAIRDALGIKSPSRLMRRTVGAHVPTGVALGILDGIPDAERAARELAERVRRASVVDASGLAAIANAGATRTLVRSQVDVSVVLRHEVTFRGNAPRDLTASEVADLLARDPRSAARIEESLAPIRGRIRGTVVTASSSR